MVSILYIILASILVFFLLLPFVEVLFSAFFREKHPPKATKELDFGCIITAYRNVDIAIPLVHSLLRQSHQNHHIYLVADNCDVSHFDLSDEKLSLLNPQPALNLKAKSIIHAVEHFKRKHDYIVIFDADNLAHPDFLSIINDYANVGYRSIQGQRTAKNLDTTIACVDALGEFYKNYVERYLSYRLGSSSVISGSGMAVERQLYVDYLNSPAIQQGKEKWKKMLQEDKILQNFLLFRKEKISYAWNAIVYDEKVSTADAVETQRSRWLYSYFQNLPNSSGLLLKGILNFNWNQLFFGLLTISLPLFILLGLSFLLFIVGFFIQPWMSLILAMAVFIFIANIFLTLWLSKVPSEIWKALGSVPTFVIKQVSALLKMRNPNKNFKHTEHSKTVNIDELINKNTSE